MRVVVQKVSSAHVEIEGKVYSEIEKGLLVLFGVEADSNVQDIDWLIHKIIRMRIFPDQQGKMNFSVEDLNGDILIISQFTLFASTRKGNRPSFVNAEKPDRSSEIYDLFVEKMNRMYPGKIREGKFGAEMKVSLVNEGPVTIIIDSKLRE